MSPSPFRLALAAAALALLGACAHAASPAPPPLPLLPATALPRYPDGTPVDLSAERGNVLVIDFWATWCEPCKVEMPWFVEFQKQYGPQGLQILGIAQDDSGADAITKFAQEMKVDYPVLQGKNAVGDAYGAEFLPTTVYIGRDGKIIDRVTGLVSKSEIEDNIKKALAQK